MKELATKLTDAYFGNRTEEWQWFEPALTYDNAVLPLSLFHATEISDDAVFKEVALKTTAFLEEATLNKGYLSPMELRLVYERWGTGDVRSAGHRCHGQCSCIFKRLTLPGNRVLPKNVSIVPVVLGENDLRVPLYDYETGCCDGLKRTV